MQDSDLHSREVKDLLLEFIKDTFALTEPGLASSWVQASGSVAAAVTQPLELLLQDC